MQGLLEKAQRLAVLRVGLIKIGEVDQGVPDPCFVADLPQQSEGRLQALERLVRLAQRVLDLRHAFEGLSDVLFFAQPALDFEGLLVIAQRLLGLAELIVDHAKLVQDRGLLFVVSKLDCQSEGAVQVVNARLRIAGDDFDTAHAQKRFDIFRIARQ